MARARNVGTLVSEDEGAELESATTVLPTFAEIYAKLAAPFDKTFNRQIPGGRNLTYITKEQAVSRLTEVLGAGWDWAVEKAEVVGDDVIVSGTLSISYDTEDGHKYTSRAGYGGSKVKKLRDGNVMDLGNDVKAAESSAFKRAASLFGVGLYLYEKSEGGEAELPSYNQAPAYGQPSQASYAPQGQRQATQFPAGPSGTSTTGAIEAVSMPGLKPDGSPKRGGFKVNGAWFNASDRGAPINWSQWQRGQVVTIGHGEGKTFIDTIAQAVPLGQGVAIGGEEIDAF